jgi:hypothetical protein
MAKRKGGKGVVAKALEALQELFLTCLLPDRRLRVLEQQPLQVRGPGRGQRGPGLPRGPSRTRARGGGAGAPHEWCSAAVLPAVPAPRTYANARAHARARAVARGERNAQALPPGRAGEKHLLLWCVEDAMKSRYSQFVGLLEGTSTDPLDYLKARHGRWDETAWGGAAGNC